MKRARKQFTLTREARAFLTYHGSALREVKEYLDETWADTIDAGEDVPLRADQADVILTLLFCLDAK